MKYSHRLNGNLKILWDKICFTHLFLERKSNCKSLGGVNSTLLK